MIQPVTLPKHEAQCIPHAHICSRKDQCARFVVSCNDPRRPLRDFTTGVNKWESDDCAGWMPAAEHRQVPTTGPTVHESIGGLS